MIAGVAIAFTRRVVGDLRAISPRVLDAELHLREAEGWLERAHDASPDGGVSYGYSLRGGWLPSYRETSGYIAETFFDLAEHRQRPAYRERALRIARWLLSVQNTDGSFANPRYGDNGLVFDTGQDLFGLVRAYAETQDPAFLTGARRAGDWLVNIADAAGRWSRGDFLGVAHAYNTRTAWALLKLHRVDPHPDRERVARANLDWALSLERDGYFAQASFRPGEAAFTHTIAYTIRGLWESGLLLDDARYREAAERAARRIARHVRPDGFLPGQIDEWGRETATYCCLTGNCQMGGIWSKVFEVNGDDLFRGAALRALDYVMRRQDVETSDLNVRGGIKGSHPIWGRYAPMSYPNWATKFFIDAMLLRRRLTASPS